MLIGILFRQVFRAHTKTISVICKRIIDAKKKNVNISSAVKYKKLSSAIRYHFSTGNWSLQAHCNQVYK